MNTFNFPPEVIAKFGTTDALLYELHRSFEAQGGGSGGGGGGFSSADLQLLLACCEGNSDAIQDMVSQQLGTNNRLDTTHNILQQSDADNVALLTELLSRATVITNTLGEMQQQSLKQRKTGVFFDNSNTVSRLIEVMPSHYEASQFEFLDNAPGFNKQIVNVELTLGVIDSNVKTFKFQYTYTDLE